MGFYKDAFIKEMEEEMAELEAQGIPADQAYELAGERAYQRLRDRLQANIEEKDE